MKLVIINVIIVILLLIIEKFFNIPIKWDTLLIFFVGIPLAIKYFDKKKHVE